MEISFPMAAASIAAACAVMAWQVLNWVWLRPKRLERCLRQQGLSGNSYRLLHGDNKDMSSMTEAAMSKPINLTDDITSRVMPFQHQMIHKYGKNFFMWLGTAPSVNVMDPKLIKEVLANYTIFIKPRGHQLSRLLIRGIGITEGEQWATRRKILNPVFHLDKLKLVIPAVQLSCDEMLGKWEMLTTESGSCELDVWPHLEGLSGDVISRTAFGGNYEEGRKIFQLQKEQAIIVAKVERSGYILGWSLLPTKTNKRMKEICNEVHGRIRGIIAERETAMKAGEAKNDDLLGILLKSNIEEFRMHSRKEMWMSIDEVIEECQLFYFAGQESSANFLAWTIILLSKHQNWQERARKEVTQVFGKNKPDYDRLSHLKVVGMILNEVLRLYPPGIVLPRKTSKETKLGEWLLPAGVQVSLPIILIHHDRDIWGKDADEFNPERFSEGVLGATKNQPAAFIPFSMGPRICLGQNFSLIEVKVALTMILQRFSFELSPSYTHAPFCQITLQPQYGAHIILHKV